MCETTITTYCRSPFHVTSIDSNGDGKVQTTSLLQHTRRIQAVSMSISGDPVGVAMGLIAGDAPTATLTLNCLPHDVKLFIAGWLPAQGVCALARCSRDLRQVCGEEGVWRSVYNARWPSQQVVSEISSVLEESQSHCNAQSVEFIMALKEQVGRLGIAMG